jgi:hypothetical protein
MHHPEHRDARAQQANRNRRPAAPLQEFARAVLRIDEPAIPGERAGGKPGLLPEKVARNDRLQSLSQAILDFNVDRCLAA